MSWTVLAIETNEIRAGLRDSLIGVELLNEIVQKQ